ncbi:MAG: hypothetical protein ACJ77V_07075 [Chloroflexota bacterium]
MPLEAAAPRSRRALLAAAAGTAAAFAAQAALPLTAGAADGEPVLQGSSNATTADTSITDSGADSIAIAGNATGTGFGYGVLGTSTGAGGVIGWSVAPPDVAWFTPDLTSYTGVFGSSPSHPDPGIFATGVWGDSPDVGVYGSGSQGVRGEGGIGVLGRGFSGSGTEGIRAVSSGNSSLALNVVGKAHFSRSGRTSMSTGTKTKTISLSGTTTSSKVFAVLATSESGRWVRAVVPAAGSFKVYLNTTLTSSAVLSWFVLD